MKIRAEFIEDLTNYRKDLVLVKMDILQYVKVYEVEIMIILLQQFLTNQKSQIFYRYIEASNYTSFYFVQNPCIINI